MTNKHFLFICIGVMLFLTLPAQAEELAQPEKVIGFNHKDPVAYTREGK